MKKALNLTFLFLFFFTQFVCYSQNNRFASINGVSFVAPPKEVGSYEINKPNEVLSANYLSIMPYAYLPENETQLQFNSDWQWWGEREEGVIGTIKMAQEAGYRIMLKPHVWKKHGSYTGHHTYESETDWKAFEKSFAAYILRFAEIADSMNVAVFCVGTEWEKFALQRPNFWYRLIKDVRSIYKGELTYAANWDEYKRISFWKQLDYIGVDAYFPLSEKATPSSNELKSALQPYAEELNEISKTNGKKILFTEFGYRSKDKSAEKPWESERTGTVNLQTQINAYEAFFDVFWNQKYIAGGFIWKWFSDYDNVGGLQHNGFTPQNKPVEKTIKAQYKLNS